ncbi:zinc-dependent alcohol dehydrogenase family protein [Microbacterium oleivorans]|uniref:zinc-dependent alcohol dehydrogenase family protein n=1 Tax=Microbacterium oleivorans TaxID=273677 RepID=UPI00203F941E|nr:zinc-dependent alcohol dehydrogenase family protein [Microbacterium oleivorans]MCM3697691.1 zinc-dependent alcohol dehydrogenase family protein [Microbacterium oleivorans]
MRAMIMDRIAGPLTVTEVPDPVAPVGGAVIEVHATGLCRSDWHAWVGHDDISLPHVPGHEFAGVVASFGPGVDRWNVGDRVTVPFVCGCGRCEWCLAGDAQVCPNQQQPGFTHWGSFAERVAIHAADRNLVAVPDQISLESAAALGCRFATAYRALTARAHLRAEQWVVIVGAGGVGLSAVMIATALGARVIAVDRSAGALEVARTLGAEHVVLADGADVPAAVHGLTGGGAHVSIDAVGSEQTCADAVLSLRRRGRHVQIGLLPSASGLSAVPMARAIAWELDLLGSHGMAAEDYAGMLELITRGALRPQALIGRTVSLAEAAALLPVMDSASPAGMTIIDPRR